MGISYAKGSLTFQVVSYVTMNKRKSDSAKDDFDTFFVIFCMDLYRLISCTLLSQNPLGLVNFAKSYHEREGLREEWSFMFLGLL
jgi:hypothetical protein